MNSRTHQITVTTTPYTDGMRNTIGGAPILRVGQTVPACQKCGQQLSLFLQFDVLDEFNVPFDNGSHFLLFSCATCDEIPSEQYCDGDETVQETYGSPVSDTYALFLNRPGGPEMIAPRESVLKSRVLAFTETDESVHECEFVGVTSEDLSFKVGGEPGWINYSVNLDCPCGGRIVFLCQIPDSWDFDAASGEPRWLSLFVGNFVYILACDRQCSPHSLIAVCDN